MSVTDNTYGTNIPNSPQYTQAALLAKTAYQNALARINQRRGSLLRQYGYTGEFDPTTGVLKGMKVDAHNPYGLYQQMLRSNAIAGDQGRENLADRGIAVNSGLGGQMEDNLKWDFGRDSSQLGQSLNDAITGFQDEQTQAKFDMDSALYEAQLAAARDAIDSGNFDPAKDPTNPDTGAADTAPTGAVSWGGKLFTSKQDLADWLWSRGADWDTWAKAHPNDAAKLGGPAPKKKTSKKRGR